MLPLGRLAEGWIAPPEVRELRELVRYRYSLIRHRTSAKAQIHGVMAKVGGTLSRNDSARFGTLSSADESICWLALSLASRPSIYDCTREEAVGPEPREA